MERYARDVTVGRPAGRTVYARKMLQCIAELASPFEIPNGRAGGSPENIFPPQKLGRLAR